MTRLEQSDRLNFYATPPHTCSYLPGRKAVTLFADPRFPKNSRLYAALSLYGFRRSGEHLYQPYCPRCRACVPVRIPVADFRPTRAQRRTLRRNRDLTVRALPARFSEEHFELYCRYLAARHAGGGMDNPTPESYMNFLTAAWADTVFFEMRLKNRLAAVAVSDRFPEAMSAVYTFFDPELSRRSLGRYAILYQIDAARRAGWRWLYLGYWIADCAKMQYKDEYQPLEYYLDGRWCRRAR